MNTKKLRIGNLVFAHGNPVIVEDIDTEGIIPAGHAYVAAEHLASMKCVPDTLKAFGFTEKILPALIIGAPSRATYTHPCGMELVVNSSGKMSLKHYEGYTVDSIDQVQNLALDLFNFDFSINLTEDINPSTK